MPKARSSGPKRTRTGFSRSRMCPWASTTSAVISRRRSGPAGGGRGQGRRHREGRGRAALSVIDRTRRRPIPAGSAQAESLEAGSIPRCSRIFASACGFLRNSGRPCDWSRLISISSRASASASRSDFDALCRGQPVEDHQDDRDLNRRDNGEHQMESGEGIGIERKEIRTGPASRTGRGTSSHR